jgi:hypothetical protein
MDQLTEPESVLRLRGSVGDANRAVRPLAQAFTDGPESPGHPSPFGQVCVWKRRRIGVQRSGKTTVQALITVMGNFQALALDLGRRKAPFFGGCRNGAFVLRLTFVNERTTAF